MSWGGHVLYMIQMMRGNGRKRPSMIKGYPRMNERDKGAGLTVNYRKIKALSDEERAILRKRVALEKQLRNRKNILAFGISLLILLGIAWVFLQIFSSNSAFYNRILDF